MALVAAASSLTIRHWSGNELQEQIRAVGKLFIGFGVVGAVGSLGVLVAFGGMPGLLAFDANARHNDLTTIPFERLAAAVYVSFSLLLTIPLVSVGRGILRWEPWAHTGGILAGAASILLFPVGTAIGLYALGVMLAPETEPLFLNPPAPLKRPEPRRNAPTKLP
jgi:hypothetical protein